jgi:hypothetical protein
MPERKRSFAVDVGSKVLIASLSYDWRSGKSVGGQNFAMKLRVVSGKPPLSWTAKVTTALY